MKRAANSPIEIFKPTNEKASFVSASGDTHLKAQEGVAEREEKVFQSLKQALEAEEQKVTVIRRRVSPEECRRSSALFPLCPYLSSVIYLVQVKGEVVPIEVYKQRELAELSKQKEPAELSTTTPALNFYGSSGPKRIRYCAEGLARVQEKEKEKEREGPNPFICPIRV